LAATVATGAESPERITQTGEIIGNPMYLSPEQLAGGQVTEEADVYSLGMLAYELLAYKPRSAQVGEITTTAQLWGTGTALSELRGDIDSDFEELVSRCLSQKPGHRPSAADAAQALSATPVPKVVPHPRMRPWSRGPPIPAARRTAQAALRADRHRLRGGSMVGHGDCRQVDREFPAPSQQRRAIAGPPGRQTSRSHGRRVVSRRKRAAEDARYRGLGPWCPVSRLGGLECGDPRRVIGSSTFFQVSLLLLPARPLETGPEWGSGDSRSYYVWR
jgi:hypothetical protein